MATAENKWLLVSEHGEVDVLESSSSDTSDEAGGSDAAVSDMIKITKDLQTKESESTSAVSVEDLRASSNIGDEVVDGEFSDMPVEDLAGDEGAVGGSVLEEMRADGDDVPTGEAKLARDFLIVEDPQCTSDGSIQVIASSESEGSDHKLSSGNPFQHMTKQISGSSSRAGRIVTPSASLKKRFHYRQHSSESDSGSDSDYIRLEPPPCFSCSSSMQTSASSQMSTSSISSSFRFIDPIPRPPTPTPPIDNDESTSSIDGDVDDRCESDISGIAADDDLSSVMYANDIPPQLSAGDAVRSYTHRPNVPLNAALTTIALLALFSAVGIGIGHYLGSAREYRLHRQQVLQMKNMQDEYLICLRKETSFNTLINLAREETTKSENVSKLWKQRYEELMVENDELKTQLKATEMLKENQEPALKGDMDSLKNDLNALLVENAALRETTLKLKYSQHPGNENVAGRDNLASPAAEKVDDEATTVNDTYEAAAMPSPDDSCPPPQPPTISSCANLLFPALNFSSLHTNGLLETAEDVRAALEQHWAMIQTAAVDALMWEEPKFSEMLKRMKPSAMFDKATAGMNHLQHALGDRFMEAATAADAKFNVAGKFKKAAERVREEVISAKKMLGEAIQGYDIDSFVNKTRNDMATLSHEVYDTLQKVKNLTTDVLKRNKILDNKVTKSVSEKIESGKEIILEATNTFGENLMKIKDDWFPKEKSEKKPGKKLSKKQRKLERKMKRMQRESAKKKDLPYKEVPIMEKVEERKDRKKLTNAELYDEFWQKTGFDPDNYFQDGFFEGNNREWHKHQEKVKRLHRRISLLNTDIFLSMDDDDIDDIYDQLDDLEDDIEDEAQEQDQLMTWVTCQLRWWKSRFQRKKRSQHLVQGCGSELSRWQIKVLCRSPGDRTKFDLEEQKCNHLLQTEFTDDLNTNGPKDDGSWYLRRGEHREDLKHSAEWYVNQMDL